MASTICYHQTITTLLIIVCTSCPYLWYFLSSDYDHAINNRVYHVSLLMALRTIAYLIRNKILDRVKTRAKVES
jgi:hypothetical protein